MPKQKQKRTTSNHNKSHSPTSKKRHSTQPTEDSTIATAPSSARLKTPPPTTTPSPSSTQLSTSQSSQQSTARSTVALEVPVTSIQVDQAQPNDDGMAANEDLTTDRSATIAFRELVKTSNDMHSLRQCVRNFVSQFFFPHVKFITRASKLAYYDCKQYPNTFCAVITRGCNLPSNINPATWWESIAKKEVKNKVAQLRSDKLTALKWDYYGKLI